MEHGVLFFPAQHHLTVEDHEAFGRHFGPLAGHPNLPKMNQGGTTIFELSAATGTGISGKGRASVVDVFWGVGCYRASSRESVKSIGDGGS